MNDSDHIISSELNSTRNHFFNENELTLPEHFSNLYILLSKYERRIWDYLQSFCQKYNTVAVTHQKIANSVGCTRRTVIRVLQKFKRYGWMNWFPRFWKSSLFMITESLSKFNMKTKDFLKKGFFKTKVCEATKNKFPLVNVTPNVTPNVTHTLKTYGYEKNVSVHEKEYFEKIMLHEIKDLFIKDWDKIYLTRYFNERILRLSLEDYSTYKEKTPVRNIAAFLVSRCKFYAKKVEKNSEKRNL